jgi:hypothetical protein
MESEISAPKTVPNFNEWVADLKAQAVKEDDQKMIDRFWKDVVIPKYAKEGVHLVGPDGSGRTCETKIKAVKEIVEEMVKVV